MPNVYAILGSDYSLIRKEAARVVGQVAGPQADEFTLDIYETGDNLTPLDALKQCLVSIDTPPFLGGPKTVWLKDFPFEHEGGAKDKDALTVTLRILSGYLKKGVPDDINLVLSGTGTDARKAFFKACKANAQLTLLEQPKITDKDWPQKVRGIITASAHDKGLTLARETVEYLINVFGVNTGNIENELEKILCYCGDKANIRCADIMDICHGDREAEYYALSTSLGKRDLNDALITIKRLMDNASNEDSAAIGILAQASNNFRLLLQVKLFMGLTRCSEASALPSAIKGLSSTLRARVEKSCPDVLKGNPWAIKYKAIDAMKYSGKELINAIHILTEASKKAVSSSCSRRLLLESCAIQIIKQ